ncbi:MAG: DUF2236 domain-containing protein [Acidimicrobiales bacterium]|nr:DUF2236 domain-containing protein [Acidimicrobiales bacterium]
MPTPADPHYPALRRFAAEPIMFIGGQRALLLQLAHPEIAAGVEHHSTFRRYPVTRLLATIDALILLVWGTPDEAVAARNRIFAVHDRVHGTLRPPNDPTPSWPAGSSYSAHDPGLQRWVWSTLVDTAFVIYRTFVGEIPESHQQAVYDDWRRLATVFNIDRATLPADIEQFRAAFAHELSQLEISATARNLAASVLDPPLPFVPRSIRQLSGLVAAGLLAARLRDGYGLSWTEQHDARFRRSVSRIRSAWRFVPPQRRLAPHAYLGARRAATAAWFVASQVADTISAVAAAAPRPQLRPLVRSSPR